MKFLILAVCLPMALAAPNLILGYEQNTLSDMGALKTESQFLLDLIGDDFTDQDCQALCDKVGKYLVNSCPSICKSMEVLKSAFRLTPHPDGAIMRTAILGRPNLGSLRQDLQMLVDVAGSDHTEQMCENVFHDYIQTGGLIDYDIPIFCKSVQMLVKLLHIVPDDRTRATGKRSFLPDLRIDDIFDLDSLKAALKMMVDVLGSDPTEQMCEAEAHRLITEGTIFDVAVPLMCKSFQALLQFFHITRDATTTTGAP